MGLAGRTEDGMGSPDVQAIVQEWIHYEILGEPEGVTALRRAYVEHHLVRCIRALALVPNRTERGRLLELGSGIYLMTFLLERLCNYDLELVQYWDKPDDEYSTVLFNRKTGRERVYTFKYFNAETASFPYPEASFDVILNCDVIEHLLCNPVHMLAECHRVLKPGGVMVVSTPNVIRLSNVSRLLRGENIYDKYCQASAYARHPREYRPQEIRRLFEEVGFRVTHLETRDVTAQNDGRWSRALAHLSVNLFDLAARFRGRGDLAASRWRGETIFLVAERAGPVRRSLPDFLFEAPALAGMLIDAICRPKEALRG